MSQVTNIILHIPIFENKSEVETYLNLWYIDHRYGRCRPTWKDYQQAFQNGNKNLESNLIIGAYNHFDLVDFIEHLKAYDWFEPEYVQLFVMEEEQDTFTERFQSK